MNNKEVLVDKDKSELKKNELKALRSKIIEAIRFSERYWMIYKERTFGIATIIDLNYKKLYIEILFFTNLDVIDYGVPLIKIYTPLDTIYDFNDVVIEPDFDEDGLISPKKIINRVNFLIEKETKHHLAILDKEVALVNENYESYRVENNPYNRKIRIYPPHSEIIIKVIINLENYPLVPKISDKNQIIIERMIKTYREKIKELLRAKIRGEIKKTILKSKLHREEIILNIDILEEWDEENLPHIFEIITILFNLRIDSQHLVLNNLSIRNTINNLTFKAHRGESIGLFYEKEKSKDNIIKNLFSSIAGNNFDYTGEIKLFGKDIRLVSNKEFEKISVISYKINPKFENTSIQKAIQSNLKITPRWKIRKRLLGTSSKGIGFFQRIDEVVNLPPKYKTKNSFIESALEVTGLINKKKQKIWKLSPVERLLFSLARVLLKSPDIIMFSIPKDEFKNVKIEQINRYIQNIKKKFHVILLIHGPKEIISNCDRIITIIDGVSEIATVDEFTSRIPHSGEIFTLELNSPSQEVLKNLIILESEAIITERTNEKYKIFSKEEPDIFTQKLINIAGPYLFSLKTHKADFNEYLEFIEKKKKKIIK